MVQEARVVVGDGEVGVEVRTGGVVDEGVVADRQVDRDEVVEEDVDAAAQVDADVVDADFEEVRDSSSK